MLFRGKKSNPVDPQELSLANNISESVNDEVGEEKELGSELQFINLTSLLLPWKWQ